MPPRHPSPRALIMEFLQRRREATIRDLVELLMMAPVTVRHHLHRLERDGLVAYRERRRRRGRPDYAFYLTPQGQEAQPKGYQRLALMLVDAARGVQEKELDGLRGEEVLEALLWRAARHRAVVIREELSGPDLGSRLEGLVDILNEENFMAEAIPTEGGYQLHGYACPYLAVARERPTLCTLDRHLYAEALPAKVIGKTSIAKGDDYCLHEISELEVTPQG